MSVAEFEKMTSDEMILHFFAETADSTMSRLALEILSTGDPTIAELRTRVTEVENAIWYKGQSQQLWTLDLHTRLLT